jgi:TIR domain
MSRIHSLVSRQVDPGSYHDGGVFISHSTKDRRFIRRLLKVLSENHIHYWISEAHIPGAVEWHDEIGRALNRCAWFLIILSPNAVKSVWVKRELMYALQPKRYKGRIIPVYFRDCKHELLSWTLAELQFIDFRKDFEAGAEVLLKLWGTKKVLRRRKSL